MIQRRTFVLLLLLFLLMSSRHGAAKKHKKKKDDEGKLTPREEQRKKELENALGIKKDGDEAALFGEVYTGGEGNNKEKDIKLAQRGVDEENSLPVDKNGKVIIGSSKKGRTPGYMKLLIKKQKEEEAIRIAQGLAPADQSVLQLQLQKQAALIENGGKLQDLSQPQPFNASEAVPTVGIDTIANVNPLASALPPSAYPYQPPISEQQNSVTVSQSMSGSQQPSQPSVVTTEIVGNSQIVPGNNAAATQLATQIAELKALHEKLMASHNAVVQHDVNNAHNLKVKQAVMKFLNTTQIHKEVGLYSPTTNDFAATGFNFEWNLFHLRHICVKGGTDGLYMGNIRHLDSSDTYFKDSFTIDTWNAMIDEAGQHPLQGKLFDDLRTEDLKVRHVKGSTFFANCMQREADSRDAHQSKMLKKLGTLYELAKTFEINADKTFGSTVFSEALKLPFAQIFLHQCGDPEGNSWSNEVMKIVFNHLKQAKLIPAELKSPLTKPHDTRADAQASHLICFEDVYLSTRNKWWIQGQLNQRQFRGELMTNLKQSQLLADSIDEEHDSMQTQGHQNYCPVRDGDSSQARIVIFQFEFKSPLEYDGNFVNIEEVINMVQSFTSTPVKIVTINSHTPIAEQMADFNSFDLLITPSGDHLSNGVLTIKPHSKAVIEVVPFLSDNTSLYNYQSELGFADYVISSGHLTPQGTNAHCPFRSESEYGNQGCYLHKEKAIENKLKQSILMCHNDVQVAANCRLRVNVQFLKRHIDLLIKKVLCKNRGSATHELLANHSLGILGYNVTSSELSSTSKYDAQGTNPILSTLSIEDGSNLSEKDPLIWISSIQDVSDHFNFMKRIWSVALSHGRSIAMVPYAYRNETLRLCDFYDFPRTIQCSILSATEVLRSKKCTRLSMEGISPAVAYQPAAYGLNGDFNLAALPVIDWPNAECVVGMPLGKEFTEDIYNRPLVPKFNSRATELFMKAMDELGINPQNDYTAVHWIRKDPLVTPACKDINNAVSDPATQIRCGTISNFVDTLHKVLTPSQLKNVYVATSETNRRELKGLKGSGLKVLNAGKYTYTPLLKYIIDMQAMIKSHTLITWSRSSSTKNLVLSSRQFSEEETGLGERILGSEIHVHRPEIPVLNKIIEPNKEVEEDESNEMILKGSEAFLDLDTEGEAGDRTQNHRFLRRHFWMDAVIKIFSNPIAIIILILFLLGYCVYDMMASTAGPGSTSYTPPTPRQEGVLERKVSTPPRKARSKDRHPNSESFQN